MVGKTNLEILEDNYNISKASLHHLKICPSFLETSGQYSIFFFSLPTSFLTSFLGLDLFHFVISSSSLTFLNLHGNVIDAPRMTRLANLLSVGKLPNLRSLVLSRYASKGMGLVNFPSTNLNDVSFEILLNFMKDVSEDDCTSSIVRRLDLSENSLSIKSFIALGNFLESPRCCFEHLSFSGI